MPERCNWSTTDQLMIEYHDKEWGKPVRNDDRLFEIFVLGGMQAGLSWRTVLHKRKNFKRAFDNFEIKKVAKYNAHKVNSLLKDEGIIRNKLKINSAIVNAKAIIKIQEEFGSFSKYIWLFVSNKPVINGWKSVKQLPAKTKLSDTISRDLKARGFQFVGTTIVYAIIQTIGLVNDHTVNCFRYKQLTKTSILPKK